jgi:hypothetical protein
MKRNKLFSILVILALLIAGLPVSGTVQADILYTTVTYDDITLPAGVTSIDMPDTWDMNQGPVVITYTLDLSGAPNVAYNWNWDLAGNVGLFDPAKSSGARMSGFLSDWENRLDQYPLYPDKALTQDLDDKFNLQRWPNPGNYDETMYDVKCDTNEVVSAFGSGNNYGIWFDRDGVDQYQDDMWGMVNGGTYNNNGVYGVQLTFQKNSALVGTVCPLMFPNLVNTWVTGGYGIPTGFYTAGWPPTGPQTIPAGLSFASDETKMGKMHVIVQGASDGGAIIIRDLTVTGYLNIDLDAPITSNVVASPNPAAVNSSVAVTANVDDTTTGGSNIASAAYSLDGGANWSLMTASDGAFNDVNEDVTASFPASGTPGIYDLCVRGTDVPGNVGDPECTMFVVYDPSGGFVTGGGWITSPAGAMSSFEAVWDQDFSVDDTGWLDNDDAWYGDIAVAGGTATFFGDGSSAPFSRFDGYRSTWPGTWVAEIDVYLDPAWPAGEGFDYSVAATGSDGAHQRDFIFHVGVVENYGPITGQALLVNGSNNADFSTNPYKLINDNGGNYYIVTTAGWYTLQHVFRDTGGHLAVDLNLVDSNGTILWTATRENAADTIPGEVGGNRYAWFTHINVAAGIQVDNHQLFMNTPSPEGKATFGFVSKYKKGATVPDGNTEFQFKAGDLNFNSTSYQWLVVNQGGTNAQFKGYGTINGAGNYGFMIWAGDGAPDTFHIKIWDAGTEVVVYDNGMDQAIGGGSIVVHKK